METMIPVELNVQASLMGKHVRSIEQTGTGKWYISFLCLACLLRDRRKICQLICWNNGLSCPRADCFYILRVTSSRHKLVQGLFDLTRTFCAHLFLLALILSLHCMKALRYG